MCVMKCLPVLVLTMLPIVQMASAGDELYRCADDTFTNRVERQCPAYESKGIVLVQGQPVAKFDGGKLRSLR